MKLFTYKRNQYLNVSIEEAWRFFSDPNNLASITPPWLGFSINSQLPEEIYAGLIIRYKVSPFLGLKLNWITEITHLKAPFYFVDEQRFGPYKFWHHQHHFKSAGNQTIVEDIVNYAIPVAGRLVNNLIVQDKLTQIFDFRYEFLRDRFGDKNKNRNLH